MRMPNSIQGWLVWAFFQAVLTFVWKLLVKLAENAMLGWGDDQIATAIGITSPSAQTAIAWAIPLLLAFITLWVYHLIQVRVLQAPTVAIHTIGNPQRAIRDNIISQIPRQLYAQAASAERALGTKVVIAWVLIIGCSVGLIVGIIVLATNKPTGVVKSDEPFWNPARPEAPVSQIAPADATPASRYFSPKEKQDFTDALYEIDQILNKKGALVVAQSQRLEMGFRSPLDKVKLTLLKNILNGVRNSTVEISREIWDSDGVIAKYPTFRHELSMVLVSNSELTKIPT